MSRTGMLAFSLLLFATSAPSQLSPEHPEQVRVPDQVTKTVAQRLGYAQNSRLLVIHADDFGMLHAVNKATIEALNHKWITSASILVPCPWFPEVVRYAREHPEWDLGIHLALTSEWSAVRWRPTAFGQGSSSLTDKDGYLPDNAAQVTRQAQIPEIVREMRAQIDTALTAGINITHLDSHMWAVGRAAPAEYLKLGRSYGLPVLMDRQVLPIETEPSAVLIDRILGLEAGTPADQWLQAYENILRPLPPGTYELIVHLAYADEEMKAATYDHADWGAQWRQNDFDLVRSPEFQKFLRDQGFILVSWRELAKALPSAWKLSK